MLRLFPRRTNDVTYFTNDGARELDGVRDGGPGWWIRGDGDTRDRALVSSVLTTSPRSSYVGYDLVVAAPRPISILLALDPGQSAGLVAAHRASVRGVISYLEERALVVRDRRGGDDRDVSATWDNIVSFTHGVNRHGEPHLHDHVLLGARPQGARGVLDSRALYAHLRPADALYRSSLRCELSRRTSWSAWRSFEGVEHVVGVDEGYRALWAGHHHDRGEKLYWSRDDTMASWKSDRLRFVALGELQPPSRDRQLLDEHQFAGGLEGRSDVARRHVVGSWANAATFGHDPAHTLRAIDQIYLELREGRGVHESLTSVARARRISSVRELGPRPLEPSALDRWVQRSREREHSRGDRSR